MYFLFLYQLYFINTETSTAFYVKGEKFGEKGENSMRKEKKNTW